MLYQNSSSLLKIYFELYKQRYSFFQNKIYFFFANFKFLSKNAYIFRNLFSNFRQQKSSEIWLSHCLKIVFWLQKRYLIYKIGILGAPKVSGSFGTKCFSQKYIFISPYEITLLSNIWVSRRLRRCVLVPYEITLLSNICRQHGRLWRVLVPYEITLLSNAAVSS